MRSPVLDLQAMKDKKNRYKGMYREIVTRSECEKRLSESMIESLENKVSQLIAEMSNVKGQLKSYELKNSEIN
jgi:hypothetical protein